MKDTFSMVMFNTLKNDMNIIMIYHFYLKKMNNEEVFIHDKIEYVVHMKNLKQALKNEKV